MIKSGTYVFLLLVGLLYACQQEENQPLENPTQIEKYFPLKDFVENQITELEGEKVRKSTRIKGEGEYIEMVLNAEEWRKELHVFIQADINKATLATSYDTEQDLHSTVHTLKTGEKYPIQEIKIDYQGKQVSRISFVSHHENLFYTSRSRGELLLDPLTGKLDTYQVSGVQKVWFIAPNEMEVEGEIIP